jgi:hypothetical protein
VSLVLQDQLGIKAPLAQWEQREVKARKDRLA